MSLVNKKKKELLHILMGRQNLSRDWAHGNFPGGPVAKTPSPSAGGLGLIPSRGTRSHMPQITPGAAKKKKKKVGLQKEK